MNQSPQRDRDILNRSDGQHPDPLQSQSQSSAIHRDKVPEDQTIISTAAHRQRGLCRSSQSPNKADPYVQRKLAIAVAIGLEFWSFYVVVGRVCTPMIQNKSSSGLGRSVGIGTLIGIIPIWLLMVWSYIKIISTGPGFAAKILPKSPPPFNPPSTDYVPYRPPDERRDVDGYQVDHNPSAPNPSELAPIGNIIASAAPEVPSVPDRRLAPDTLLPRPVPHVDTAPRWCRFCEINKPDRTHHCRHCGTCVMQFDLRGMGKSQGKLSDVDHADKQFFINFNFWTTMYCVYMLIFLLVTTTRAPTPDGQIIGAIAVAALFGLFTWAMLTTHIHLIVTGRTTVESYRGRDQREEEARVLQMQFGYLWRNLEKRQVRRRWIEEWGGSAVDGRWRHGNMRQMWEQEMGKDPLGWFLPLGRPLGDGMHFSSNPRFGPHGEWLRKRDWPKGVV